MTGLLSFGFVAMIVYLVAGPDGVRPVSDGRREEPGRPLGAGDAHSGAAPPAR
ncbi:MAG: hypothetical protein AVDCRST_MAG66-1666 [uncultured Pseudonocardia sp.]|uniref:Uncharacterized protein n=1 Tax=uncultured Pseudonocardia sp. TaxID=211455 RepID=A0A6J4P0T0_9PSEU|nr:MAG: hypothetical protein AVDCRST_MAG66-1666 [uncultured Pseudonocardia sp.]